MHEQHAWEYMAQHWCDRGDKWPDQHIKERNKKAALALHKPAYLLGALYNHVREESAYTQRSLFYAQLFQSFRKGYDPQNDIDWDLVRAESIFCLLLSTPFSCELTFDLTGLLLTQ